MFCKCRKYGLFLSSASICEGGKTGGMDSVRFSLQAFALIVFFKAVLCTEFGNFSSGRPRFRIILLLIALGGS